MKNVINKYIVLTLLIFVVLLTGCSKKENKNTTFDLWKSDGVINEVIAYVEDVTNEKSENFIPKEDRIVVFDLMVL